MTKKNNTQQASTQDVSPEEIRNAQNMDDGLGNLSDLALRWDVNNCDEFTPGTLVLKDGKLGARRSVDEVKDGNKTGRKIDKAVIFVLVGDKVKETTLYNAMITAFSKAWGADRKNWVGKKVRAKHAGVGTYKHLQWAPDVEEA